MLRHLLVILSSLAVLNSNEVTVQMGADDNESDAVRAQKQEIIEATKKLLTAIGGGDFEAYKKMRHPDLTSFESESIGVLVKNMEFHRYFIENVLPPGVLHTLIVNPHVHMLGKDAAYIAYIRLTQSVGQDFKGKTDRAEETRIWQRNNGTWLNVHFHRTGSTSLHTK
ncbi:calcium/calmodulin-dependent protein kinase type II delta chain-like [Corythoichthys intestinalis]|uniref:calcium/calmodulin-dependent protein kinase type II delta chain-like n=1 Tax=Corythoichthys intestinalis TaxID=161448 RepID=UPI0025A57781|nr:calcium/calmodulin-dependent protein kinase type II delta chain-like [Corythoichthys intestinalis]XP_061789073.1 calcium/calmodulin-dependent protein kinase type II delta chain-like [Nerophis lumbriciformis]